MRYHLLLLIFVGLCSQGALLALEDEELARAMSQHAATITQLDDVLEQARRSHSAGVEAAHRKLLDAHQDAIHRALDVGDKQAVERLRQEKRRIASRVPRTGAIMHGSRDRGLATFLLGDRGQFAVGQPISLTYGLIAVERPADDAGRERIAVTKPLPAFDPHNGSWFSVTGPDEQKLPYQGPFISWAANRSDLEDSLGPGELVGRTSELNLSFDFSRPGKYRLQWHYGWDGPGLVSNEIQIEIVPADGAALGAAANNGVPDAAPH